MLKVSNYLANMSCSKSSKTRKGQRTHCARAAAMSASEDGCRPLSPTVQDVPVIIKTPVRDSDVEQAWAIECETFGLDDGDLAAATKVLSWPPACFLVAKDAETGFVLGSLRWAFLNNADDAPPRRVKIEALTVRADEQRRMVGTRLLVALKTSLADQIVSTGVSVAISAVVDMGFNSGRAVGWYANYGFDLDATGAGGLVGELANPEACVMTCVLTPETAQETGQGRHIARHT